MNFKNLGRGGRMITCAKDLALLEGLPLFCNLTPNVLARITSYAVVNTAPPGSILFDEGEDPAYLHILLEGQVGLVSSSAEGQETVVEILKAGEVFIPAAVLTGRPYLMGAKVLQQARLLLLPGDRLRAELRETSELAMAMLTSLSVHYRMLVREVKSLKMRSAAQRLGLYLLGLTPKNSRSCMVRLPHSKTVIASRIGIRPESISRAFNALDEAGVRVQGNAVVIADTARLAEYCQDDDPV
ncbi:MAG: cyclic nucleotide-binding domain-containing protein [Rhodospirillales bacterium]|nr:cyclic nucleotide-binding domain-containing protein [Rhodospirillales bacterium]